MAPSFSRITNSEPNPDQADEESQPVQHQNTGFASALDFVQQLYQSVMPPSVPSHGSESDDETPSTTPTLPGSYPKSVTSSPIIEPRLELPPIPSAPSSATFGSHKLEVCDMENRPTRPPSTGLPVSATTGEHTVSTLQGAHNFTIGDHARITNIGVNKVTNYGGIIDLDIMKKFMEEFVSFHALHDSPVQDPDRQCHPETRRGVLKQLQDWIDDPDAIEPIFWLHGPAGVGKSAIAQTIARSCSRDMVPASFFFYRSDPSRNDGNRLFTTLAWQLALSIPGFKAHLINSLNERPDLPRKDVETQFEELIVRPLQALNEISSQTPAPVVIIDGFDECVDEKLQRRILKVIGSAISDRRVPLRFLICSRPDAHIQETVENFQCSSIPLDLAKLDDANKDIETYLKAEFSRIASDQDLDPSWPGEAIIQEFVYKASGQFIYASTLIRFIGDEYSCATTQLDIVLGVKPFETKKPFAELDALYMEILKRQPDWNFLHDILSIIIGHFIVLPPSITINGWAILLNISKKELCRKLRGMRSLLKLDPSIDIYHRSFLEFLKDSSRSSHYHISLQAAEKRSLDIVTTSIVLHVPKVLEQRDCHERHFSLFIYLYNTVLSAEELQQAGRPLVDIHKKLLTVEKYPWQRLLRCDKCNIVSTIRNLLLHLTCRQELSKAAHPIQMVEQDLIKHTETFDPMIPFVVTGEEQIMLEKSNLDDTLSSVLVHLRETKLSLPLSTMIIDLICSLLSFDYIETAMRVCSFSDGQLLVDVIDYLINNGDFLSRHGTAIAHRAARLALEVHARVPVLPRSMFCSGDLPKHSIFENVSTLSIVPPPLFTPAFVGRTLDRDYILRVLWTLKEGRLTIVHDSKNTCKPIQLEEWRRSNPGLVMILRVMLEVAKAIQYVNSMHVLLHCLFNLREIFLDSECHVKIFPWGTILSLTSLSSEEVHQRNVFILGCTLYEVHFTSIPTWFRSETNNQFNDDMIKGPEPPSEPEISDELWQVIQRCYAPDPKSRPSIHEVVEEIESLKID